VGKSIRLYLADSTPGGLLTAEIMSWTGHVVAAPRSDLAALLKRDETSRTGIYVLLGDDPESLGGTSPTTPPPSCTSTTIPSWLTTCGH
jgi:hypothetical protein